MRARCRDNLWEVHDRATDSDQGNDMVSSWATDKYEKSVDGDAQVFKVETITFQTLHRQVVVQVA